MNSLLLDSSAQDLSIGIVKKDELIYQVCFPCWQRQSELMIPELEKALQETGMEIKDFDEIVCGKGPGSYTGVRIALTIAKTICVMDENIKLKLVSSLLIQGTKNKKFISVMNARSARSYVCVYDGKEVEVQDTIMTNEEVLNYINAHKEYEVVGDCSYLGLEKEPFDIVEGLFSFKDEIEEEKDIMVVKPVYLKD